MIITKLTQRDFEEVENICEAYRQIKDDLGKTSFVLNFLQQIKQGWCLLFQGDFNPNVEIRHDEQLIKDFESALEAYRGRCEDKLSGLTLTLGGGDEA